MSSSPCPALTRCASLCLTLVLSLLCAGVEAQTVRNRVAVLIDSSGSMLTTPEQVTFPETCAAQNWNGCTSSGNPTTAQENCNACMARTIRQSASCATNFTTNCRNLYTTCWRALNSTNAGCAQTLNARNSVTTRGDGTALAPGCDVNGDGLANDSAIYQAKDALRSVVQGSPNVELALWRFAQVEGGQVCSVDSNCPSTPAGEKRFVCKPVAGVNRCVLDAATLGSANGQCGQLTWNGADNSFSCAQCSDSGYERVLCEAYGLQSVRTGGTSPLQGKSVQCALPTTDHPYLVSHGAALVQNACDPNGGELLVDFPISASADNRPALNAWLDNVQPSLNSDVELTANGATPIAASLRDLRTFIFNAARNDRETPCRRHRVVLVLGGTETCESAAAGVMAASSFQNMSFTNAANVFVPDYDVPVYVLAFGVCPAGQTNCPELANYNQIAAAGGTGAAIQVDNAQQLKAQLAALSNVPSTCGCGDGTLGAGEQCDDGTALNGTTGSCCTTSCTLRPANTVCRASTGQCDAPETCGGQAKCPANAAQPNGTACNDTNACTQSDTCQAGACVGTTNDCGGHGTCGSTGACACASGFSGASCGQCAADYYNFPTCTRCVAAECAAPAVCHEPASCSTLGACSYANSADGTSCPGGMCAAGVCMTINSQLDASTIMLDATMPADANAPVDATVADATVADATVADAAVADAGDNLDIDAAAASDAGRADAGKLDAGKAGNGTDDESDDTPGRKDDGGCRVASAHTNFDLAWLALLGLVFARRRASGSRRRIPAPSRDGLASTDQPRVRSGKSRRV